MEFPVWTDERRIPGHVRGERKETEKNEQKRKESSPHTFVIGILLSAVVETLIGRGGGEALSCADVDTRSGGGHASLRKETSEASLKRTHTHRKGAYILPGSSCKM